MNRSTKRGWWVLLSHSLISVPKGLVTSCRWRAIEFSPLLASTFAFLATVFSTTSLPAQEEPEKVLTQETVREQAIDDWKTYAKRLEDFVFLPYESASDPEAKRNALVRAELQLIELKDLLNSVSDCVNEEAGPHTLRAVHILTTSESGDTSPALQYLDENREAIAAEAKSLADRDEQNLTAIAKVLRPLLLKSALHQFRLEDEESLRELRFIESIVPKWVAVNRDLGDLMEETGNLPEAIRYFNLTVEMDAPPGHKAHDYLALGRLYFGEGKYGEAAKVYRQALVHMEETGGKTASRTLTTRELLADALKMAGEIAEAEKLYRDTALTRQLTQGMNHPDAMICKGRLARLLAENQRYEEAEEILNEVVGTLDTVLGPENESSIAYTHLLAHVILRQLKYEQAIPHYERVVKARLDVQPPIADSYFGPASELVVTYLALEQYDKAEPLVLDLLKRATDGFGPDSADAALLHHQYGELLLESGRPREAIEHLQFVHGLYKIEHGENDPSSLRCSSLIADCYQALNEFDKAEAIFRKNISGYEEAFGANHKNVEWARGKLEACLAAKENE